MKLVVNLDYYILLGLGQIQSYLEDGWKEGLAEYASDFVLPAATLDKEEPSWAILNGLPCAGRMRRSCGSSCFCPAGGGEIREGSDWLESADGIVSGSAFWVEESKSGGGVVDEAWLKIGRSRVPFTACASDRPALVKAVAKRAGEICKAWRGEAA